MEALGAHIRFGLSAPLDVADQVYAKELSLDQLQPETWAPCVRAGRKALRVFVISAPDDMETSFTSSRGTVNPEMANKGNQWQTLNNDVKMGKWGL